MYAIRSYYVSAAEVWLLRAEAALFEIADGDANEMYQTAIQKSMTQWGIVDTVAQNYVATNPNATLSGSREDPRSSISGGRRVRRTAGSPGRRQ